MMRMDVILIVVKISSSFHLPVLTSRNVDLFIFNSSNFPAQQGLASQQSWEHKCSEVKWFAQGQTAVRLLILSLDSHHGSKAQQCSEKHLSYNLRAQGSSFRCSKHGSSSVTLMLKDPDLWLGYVLAPLSLVPFLWPAEILTPALLFYVLCKCPGCGRESKWLDSLAYCVFLWSLKKHTWRLNGKKRATCKKHWNPWVGWKTFAFLAAPQWLSLHCTGQGRVRLC